MFEVAPDGLDAGGDFSFLVIGDPGEGDPSQHALRDQVLAAARKDAVKFVVIASDVVYPLGADEGLRGEFLPAAQRRREAGLRDAGQSRLVQRARWLRRQPDGSGMRRAPRLMRASNADLSLSSTTDDRIERLIADAARLRSVYRVPAGRQHGPFFELHHGGSR